MDDETELKQTLEALLKATARFFDVSQRHYRAIRPDDHAAYCTLVEKAGAEPYVEVVVSASPRVTAGFVYKGEREGMYVWPGPQSRANAN